jgi:hypothetical protein
LYASNVSDHVEAPAAGVQIGKVANVVSHPGVGVPGQGLLEILRGCRAMRDRWHAGTAHVAREALWSFWERPRLPKPTSDGKYPLVYSWSAAARAAYEANPKAPKGGRGLVLAHLRPRTSSSTT